MEVLHQMLAEWHMFWSFDVQKSVRIHWNCRQVDAACSSSCLRHSVSQGCFKGFCYKICHVEMAFLFAIRTKCRWQLRMLLLFPSFPIEKLTLCWPRKPWQNQSLTLCSPCDLLRCNISWVGKDRSSWQRRTKVESWKFISNTDPKKKTQDFT